MQLVSKLVPEIPNADTAILMVLSELNFYNQVRYSPEGNLLFYLTDLQWLAFAAAIVGVHENNGFLSDGDVYKSRVTIEQVKLEPYEVLL